MYSGGAEKLSSSTTGLLSTITGKLKSNMADMGQSMLEPLKPVMTNAITLIDSVTPKMLEFGTKLGEGISKGIEFINIALPKIKPVFDTVFNSIKTTLQTVAPAIGQAITTLSPIFTAVFEVGKMAFNGITKAIQEVAPIVQDLCSRLQPAFENIGNIVQNVGTIFFNIFNAIKDTVINVYNAISPVLNSIGNLIKNITGAVSSVTGFFAGNNNKSNKKTKSNNLKPSNLKMKVSSKISKNATGTKYFTGGLSLVGEHGAELVQMPAGSKVFTNRETNNILNQASNNNIPNTQKTTQKNNSNTSPVIIEKIADTITIREEADIDKIMSKLVKTLGQNAFIYGG